MSENEQTTRVEQGNSDEGERAPEATVGGEDGPTAPVPSAEEMEAALDGVADRESAGEADDPAAGATGLADDGGAREADTRVLEFTLGDERYCLDIEYVEEIVEETTVTRVPNTPDVVEGVVDLRGQITTILNPKESVDAEETTPGGLVVVFDGETFDDQGHVGWLVDDVEQVSPVRDEQVTDPPMDEEYVEGVIDREDDEFVIWTTPDLVFEALGDEG